jgi:iron complex outermembrane receptor protein
MEGNSGRRRSLLLCSAVVGVVTTTTSLAEERIQLDEVVVTAQKRAQSIQDVPISVSAFVSEQLVEAGVNDITDAARLIPALEVQSSDGPGSVSYRLRRVGNLGLIPAFEPAVGLFVDGAFRNRSFFGSGELLDLDRIEVLNGPQSTLYGKNTTAGVISMFSRAPQKTSTFTTQATLGDIDFPSHPLMSDVKASWSGPLSERWGASLSAGWYGQNYALSSGFPGGPDQDSVSRYASRAQLSYTGDHSDLRLIIEQLGQNDRDGSPTATTFLPGAPSTQVHNFLIAQGLAAPCTGAGSDPRNYGNCLLYPVQTNLGATDATLLWNNHFADGLTLSSVTSWDNYSYSTRQNDVAQLGAPMFGYYDRQTGRSLQEELRLASSLPQRVNWLTGVFYYHNDSVRGDPNQPMFYSEQLSAAPFWKPLLQQLVGAPVLIATPGQQGIVDSSMATDYIGLFGQTSWYVTDAFQLNTGIRWQDEKKNATIYQSVNDPTPTLISLLLNTPIPRTDLSRSSSKVTWSVTPQLNLTRSTMVYATAARGFKSGGYNTGFGQLPAEQREFGDETVNDYELGMKASFWGGRARMHVAVFDTQYNNYQDAAFIGAQFAVNNAQKATDRGVDLGVDAYLTGTLSGTLDVSYADFKYATYTDGVCYPGRTPDGSMPGTCNLSGQHPINAPPLKLALGLDERVPVSFGEVFAHLGADWTARYNTSFSADPRLTQNPYTWVRARVGAGFGSTELIFWAENLLNTRVAYADALPNLFSQDPNTQTYMQPPRSYGLTVRMKF